MNLWEIVVIVIRLGIPTFLLYLSLSMIITRRASITWIAPTTGKTAVVVGYLLGLMAFILFISQLRQMHWI